MSTAWNVFVDPPTSLDDVANVVARAVGRELVAIELWRVTPGGWPRISVGPNRLDPPHVEDGYDLASYPVLVRCEGEGASAARAVFEAVEAMRWRALLEDPVAGFIDACAR